MMSSKKRSADSIGVEDLKTAPATGASSARKLKKAGSPKATKSVLTETKRSLWQQHIETLNEKFKQDLQDADDNQTFLLACEYKRVVSDIDALYHGVKCDVVTMGNDDGFQMGIQTSADADKDVDYIPTLVRQLPGAEIVCVAAGGLHSAAVSDDGQAYTWGVDDDGALGRVCPESQFHKIEQVKEGFAPEDRNKIVNVCCGDSHTLFLTVDGKVYCTGMYKDCDSGKFKVVPAGVTKCKGTNFFPVQVTLPKTARAIFAGFNFDVALLEDDSLVTWGMGHNGELARSKDMGAPMKDGKYDLGRSWIGEEYETEEEVRVVNEETEEVTIKKEKVSKYRYFEDMIAKKFLAPQPPRWSTPGKRKVLSVACGELFLLVVARMEGSFDSDVYAAGNNAFGQLAHEDVRKQKEYHELTPIQAFKGKMISKVAAGASHCLALNLLGTAVYSWGKCDYGQLGYPVDISSADYRWEPKRVAFPAEVADVCIKDIACGAFSSFAIMDNQDVYSWGYGDSCTTGFRSSKDIIRPKRLDVLRKYKKEGGPTNCHVHQVSGGGQHTIMLIKRYS